MIKKYKEKERMKGWKKMDEERIKIKGQKDEKIEEWKDIERKNKKEIIVWKDLNKPLWMKCRMEGIKDKPVE